MSVLPRSSRPVAASRWIILADVAKEMSHLRPLMIQLSPSRTAVVEMSRPVPLSGSVRPNVTVSPSAMRGSQWRFWASVPYWSTSRHMPLAPCTTIRSAPLIPATSSSTGKYSAVLRPWPPHSLGRVRRWRSLPITSS